MALRNVLKNHQKLSQQLLQNYATHELLVVVNVRHISNTSHQTQLAPTSYGTASNITALNNKLKLPKYMSFGRCSPASSSSSSMAIVDHVYDRSPSMAIAGHRRPLTMIFAWMLAKDKHIEKYKQMWFKRGFDVLIVKTSPLDLLLPPVGGQVVAANVVKSLHELCAQYNEIVVHAFSVGGYQFGLTLQQLTGIQENRYLLDSIKGLILDSMVFTEDCAPGLSRAITQHPAVQPLIEQSINGFLRLFKNISVKYYDMAYNAYANPGAKYSGLFLYAKNDIVSSVASNEHIIDTWRRAGHNVRAKCWDRSTHVLHYRDHKTDYELELDSFIRSLKLRNANI
ncbi:transmembrane protein 53-like [Oppia nitens]|uniref:transmembrane protein 53-like n=1 Tax=Oppia nitens TaxID=1686743 RepID=UPI0023DAA573|nr:transmembrane protein 53-like [Oppia nitens]